MLTGGCPLRPVLRWIQIQRLGRGAVQTRAVASPR